MGFEPGHAPYPRKNKVDRPPEEVFESRHKKPNGLPVCVYESEKEREAMDKEYKVIVTDLKAGNDKDKVGGTSSCRVNGLPRNFPTNVVISLYGFQVRQLRGCTFRQPEVTWDEQAGQLKMTGRELEASRFRVERKDDGLDF